MIRSKTLLISVLVLCINFSAHAQEPLNYEADSIQVTLSPEENFRPAKRRHPLLLLALGLPIVLLSDAYNHAFDYGRVESRKNSDKEADKE